MLIMQVMMYPVSASTCSSAPLLVELPPPEPKFDWGDDEFDDDDDAAAVFDGSPQSATAAKMIVTVKHTQQHRVTITRGGSSSVLSLPKMPMQKKPAQMVQTRNQMNATITPSEIPAKPAMPKTNVIMNDTKPQAPPMVVRASSSELSPTATQHILRQKRESATKNVVIYACVVVTELEEDVPFDEELLASPPSDSRRRRERWERSNAESASSWYMRKAKMAVTMNEIKNRTAKNVVQNRGEPHGGDASGLVGSSVV
jgi:hypothetical protein